MKKKNKYNIKETDVTRLASSQDYTGLLPRLPENDAEQEAFEELADTRVAKKKQK